MFKQQKLMCRLSNFLAFAVFARKRERAGGREEEKKRELLLIGEREGGVGGREKEIFC